MSNVYKIKEMALMESTIQTFHVDHYRPTINRLAFHRIHFTILEKNHCGKTRHRCLKIRHRFMKSKICHGYSERLSYQFCKQIQYKQNINNRSLSKEGISSEHSQCQDDNTSDNLTFNYIIKSSIFVILLY